MVWPIHGVDDGLRRSPEQSVHRKDLGSFGSMILSCWLMIPRLENHFAVGWGRSDCIPFSSQKSEHCRLLALFSIFVIFIKSGLIVEERSQIHKHSVRFVFTFVMSFAALITASISTYC
jgi:hypothetical protein